MSVAYLIGFKLFSRGLFVLMFWFVDRTTRWASHWCIAAHSIWMATAYVTSDSSHHLPHNLTESHLRTALSVAIFPLPYRALLNARRYPRLVGSIPCDFEPKPANRGMLMTSGMGPGPGRGVPGGGPGWGPRGMGPGEQTRRFASFCAVVRGEAAPSPRFAL